MAAPAEYRHIAAWGQYTLACRRHVEAVQRSAAEWDAPLDAIYWHSQDARWVTFGELTDPRAADLVAEILLLV